MGVYQVSLQGGDEDEVVVEAGSWMQAGIKAKKEHGGSIRDISPLRDCVDIVEVHRTKGATDGRS